MQEVMASQGNGATRTGHITLASPAVLLKNALGFTIAARTIPSHTTMTWISFAVVVFGSLLLAAWVFLQAQGVETWEATRPQRWILALALLSIALFPVIFAETTYDGIAPAQSRAPQNRFGARHGDTAALVPTGASMPRRCCSIILNWDRAGIPANQSNRRDLLLLCQSILRTTSPTSTPRSKAARAWKSRQIPPPSSRQRPRSKLTRTPTTPARKRPMADVLPQAGSCASPSL